MLKSARTRNYAYARYEALRESHDNVSRVVENHDAVVKVAWDGGVPCGNHARYIKS